MSRRAVRRAGFVIGGAILVWLAYVLLRRPPEIVPPGETNPFLLSALSLGLVVLALGLAGVLIRNLVKLILERKRGILGSKLRTKLVFFFLALVLLPAIVLFAGSAKVIKETVEAIFLVQTPFEELRSDARGVVDTWSDWFQSRCLEQARDLAAELKRAEARDGSEIGELLERRRRQGGFDLVWEVVHGNPTARADGPAAEPAPVRRAIEDFALQQAGEAETGGQALRRLDRLPQGLLAHAAAPLGDGRTVVVGAVLPSGIAFDLGRLDDAVQAYGRFRIQRRDLVRFYVTLIGVIFLATLFVATWMGFYLSRRITVPIQDLAAAAREISAGNLGVRVKAKVGDELAMLVEAFNEMAAELEESRTVITRSTADLRRTNRALDERRRYIETLVANLSTAVISVDPAGHVTTTNPAVARILGLDLLPGESARERFRQSGLVPLADLLDATERAGAESLRRDLELARPSGTLHVSVQLSALRGGGSEPLGMLIMVEDLSDVLRAQKALVWEEVARRIAHEIKNPLTPIRLAAQRLRKKFLDRAPDLDRVLLDATATIESEVQGLGRLVDEFSRFARMPEVVPRPVEFRRVIEAALALYQGLPGIEWIVEIDPQVGSVNVDSEQMRRALINLIDNAIAAMQGSGTLAVTVRACPAEGLVRVEVADSGPGFGDLDPDKVFVPYFSTKKRGTGLGLAIVHKVVSDHHGTIRVMENAPHGARFVIDLPA